MSRLEDIQMSDLSEGRKEGKARNWGNCFYHLCPIKSCKEDLPQSRDSDRPGPSCLHSPAVVRSPAVAHSHCQYSALCTLGSFSHILCALLRV